MDVVQISLNDEHSYRPRMAQIFIIILHISCSGQNS